MDKPLNLSAPAHEFARRVAQLLKTGKMPEADLARETGIPFTRLELILRGGATDLRLGEMAVIAAVLATPLSDLLKPAVE